MPNWCYNTVTLNHGDIKKVEDLKEQLKVLMEDADNKTGMAEYFLPRPASEEHNWYEWNVNHWGTKWDFEPLDWDFTEDGVQIQFESAWSPPIALYEFLFSEGWTVEAMYHEPGVGFVGQYINGSDDCYEYDISDPNAIKQIPEDLKMFGNLDEEHEIWKEYNETEGEA